MATGERILETYHAALQHDLVDLPEAAHLAGVVRRPTGWFRSQIDENYPALGPPEDLLDETKTAGAELEADLDEVAAHNTAWDVVDFERRYREYLATDETAEATLEALAGRVRSGEPVALVCYEGPEKRCHRHVLREALRERLA